MRRGSIAVLLASLLAVVLSAGACSSESTSPQDAVCKDASSFKDSVTVLVDDVKSGNFGEAKNQRAKVKSSFDALESSTKDLASSEKASVQSDLNGIKVTLSNLSSATSIDDMKATLGRAESQLNNAVTSIKSTLSC